MAENEKILTTETQKSVLIAPLDWGLGHATRCIPIIKELIVQGFEVIIAASGAPGVLLQKEFPGLEFLTIDNYNIRYSNTKNTFVLQILKQIFKIRKAITKEKRWLTRLIKSRKIDVIISDNRPGLCHPQAHCIYITHQVNIKTGNRITNYLANLVHHRFIKKFDECWIPDTETGTLAGELSYPTDKNLNACYIGPLSRFETVPPTVKFEIAILLSGPEPQRSILEQLLLSQTAKMKQKIILVRGLPEVKQIDSPGPNVTIINHLEAKTLNEIICGADLVISRSGYTSIMDYARLRKKAVLIPTPGQPEQEYLARYLAGKKYFLFQDQENFALDETWDREQSLQIHFPEIDFHGYKDAIKELSKKIT